MHVVPDAPVINRTVYASFHASSGREELINKVIEQIATNVTAAAALASPQGESR
jgi:hypothetical protein